MNDSADFCYNCGCIGHSFWDCEITMAEKGKLSYDSWLKAPSRAGGIKSRPFSPNKSSGKSESYQTTSSLRDKDEQVANSNFRALVPHQELDKKSREENNMIDRNREMSIELEYLTLAMNQII